MACTTPASRVSAQGPQRGHAGGIAPLSGRYRGLTSLVRCSLGILVADMLDKAASMGNDGLAVRSGIRVACGRKKPREFFGVVTRGTRSKSFRGIPDASPLPGAATAKGLSGLLRSRAAVKAHVVMGSQGARTPRKPEPLAALCSRGAKTELVDTRGLSRHAKGWQPMRTVASGRETWNERSGLWVSPRLH